MDLIDATLNQKNKVLGDMKADLPYLPVWLEASYKHAEAEHQLFIARRKTQAAGYAAAGCTVPPEELLERPCVEISWESYVDLIVLAQAGLG